MKSMLRLLKNLRSKEWVLILIAVGFIVGSVFLDLEMPKYMKEITRLVTTPGNKMGDVWINGGWMMLCALGSLVSAIIVAFIAARIGASLSKRLRSKIFNKVDSFSFAEVNRFGASTLITRTTNDVTQVQMLVVMGLQIIVKAPVLAIWAITIIAGKGMEWTIATGIAVAVMLTIFVIVAVIVLPRFRKIQVQTDDLTKVARENLAGLPVVHAYNAEKFQNEKFEGANDRLTRTHLFTARGMAFLMPMMTLIISGLTLAITWIGAYVIDKSVPAARQEIFEDMTVFSAYAMQILMAFMMITMMFVMLPRALVSAKRINEVFDTNPSVVGGTVTAGQDGLAGEIVFNNVSFKYPEAADYVIKDITFTAKKGETVAFIGSTGSGKSTVVNLIPRFYDPTDGNILINGTDIKEYTLESLRDKIGYISQKAVLFSGTVNENIAFGNEQSNQSQIENAVNIAQAKDFVEKMENKYNSDIARAGKNLSGGQKQRISIARAIYKKPEIFIFDDSFSALDYKTDRTLRTALKTQINDATVLIVAQRIGTIREADKIIVLDEGRVVGMGKHNDLLENCRVYKEIAASQLTEEELAKSGGAK